MPQASPGHAMQHPRLPVRIAQAHEEPGAATHGADAVASETHATGEAHTEHAHEHKPGDIPSATLLLWNSATVALLMVLFALAARKKLEAVPRGLQNFAELIVESLNQFTVAIIGHGGEKYTPLVGTVFVYIFLMNLWGQIPGFHSPTANLSITFALGFVIFVYVQIQGIRNLGVGNYIQHFAGGSMPWQGVLIPIKALLLFPVELISECVKPFTLAIRLFGNVFGEDVILLVLAGLGLSILGVPGLPLHFPLVLLALLTSFVQAMVFSILTCIYLSMMQHHHEEEHAGHGAPGTSHAHATGH